MHPKDDSPPPRAPMEEEDTSPSSSDIIVEEAQVVSEKVDPGLDPRIGETLVGRYRLDKLVGKGGMGRVYRATQFPLNRPVAVKILNPDFQQKDPQFVRRFFLEAASAARLTHPNTITVFDYGEAESGELFIAMEYLRGRPLSKVITAEGPCSGERVLHIAMQICRALREAHSKGIIHRDLKPGNILLLEEGDDADFVKVLDFGLVKLFTPPDLRTPSAVGEPLTPGPIQEGDLTKAGMFLGSPKYMSPEQIQTIPLDPRTDIYSLGVLMYQMTCGKPPFTGATSVEVIYKHVNHPVPRFAEMLPGHPIAPELEAAINRCLAKKREDRFESMAELLVRLKDVRKLLTGISMSSEIGIDLRSMDPFSGAVITEDPSQSVSVSKRPQTHPRAASQLTASLRSAADVSQASAFVELHEDANPTNSLMRRVQSPARFALPVAAAAFVLVLGVLAYVLSRPAPSSPPRGVQVEAAQSRVRFTSVPAGAEVFEGGVSLGHTPLSVTRPRSEPGAPPKQFILKLEGHHDEIHEATLDSATMDIRVRLRSKPSDADPTSEDYKENPY